MKPKLTPWFNLATQGKPVRPGFYQCAYDEEGKNSDYFSIFWFDGRKWRFHNHGTQTAFGNIKEDQRQEYWRGLAEDPAKDAP